MILVLVCWLILYFCCLCERLPNVGHRVTKTKTNFQDDKHDGVDSVISMKVKALKLDLFEQSVFTLVERAGQNKTLKHCCTAVFRQKIKQVQNSL